MNILVKIAVTNAAVGAAAYLRLAQLELADVDSMAGNGEHLAAVPKRVIEGIQEATAVLGRETNSSFRHT